MIASCSSCAVDSLICALTSCCFVLADAGEKLPGLNATMLYNVTITPATGAQLAHGDNITITGAPANTSISCTTDEASLMMVPVSIDTATLAANVPFGNGVVCTISRPVTQTLVEAHKLAAFNISVTYTSATGQPPAPNPSEIHFNATTVNHPSLTTSDPPMLDIEESPAGTWTLSASGEWCLLVKPSVVCQATCLPACPTATRSEETVHILDKKARMLWTSDSCNKCLSHHTGAATSNHNRSAC